VFVCVCVCVHVREREGEREGGKKKIEKETEIINIYIQRGTREMRERETKEEEYKKTICSSSIPMPTMKAIFFVNWHSDLQRPVI
jgi:hypothetical protein